MSNEYVTSSVPDFAMDLRTPFDNAIKQLNEGKLHLVHVGMYEDRIVQ